MSLTPVPSLDELAADPGKAVGLPPDVARALTLRCAAVLAALGAAPPTSAHSPVEGEDRLLDVREAADRLRTSADYLYRHAKRLPFTVRMGRRLRFSARGIERYIHQRQGRVSA